VCVYVIRLRADNGAESPRSSFFPEQRGAEGVIVSAEYNLCGKKHWEYPHGQVGGRFVGTPLDS